MAHPVTAAASHPVPAAGAPAAAAAAAPVAAPARGSDAAAGEPRGPQPTALSAGHKAPSHAKGIPTQLKC